MPDTRVRLIDHAGPWALARADLGNGGRVPAIVVRDRILDLPAVSGPAVARTVTRDSSDYPFDMGVEDPVGRLAAAGLDEAAVSAIRGGNAVRLLGPLPGYDPRSGEA